jgi:hypothetical protein
METTAKKKPRTDFPPFSREDFDRIIDTNSRFAASGGH